jgi:hypothetical protein
MLDNYCPVHIPFPLWPFLNQPLFTSTEVILNPFLFQHHYRIQLLERCWDYELIHFLDRCWVKGCELTNLPSASKSDSSPTV